MKTLFMLLISTSLLFSSSLKFENLEPSNTTSYFVENVGQWPENVKFLARFNGMNAWITNSGVVYDYYKIIKYFDENELKSLTDLEKDDFIKNNSTIKGHVFVTDFYKSSNPSISGSQKDEAYYNYFIGNDISKWADHVSLYKSVNVKNIYDGIDIHYYFDQGFLRYDFIVRPGADISQINIKIDGANSKSISENGDMIIKTVLGEITHKDIIALQGSEKRECKFVLKANNLIGFDVQNYNKSKELIIDPLVYSTFLGAGNADYGYSIVNDDDGNLYITGETYSSSFPTTTGAYDQSFNGSLDIFVTKLNASGSGLVYSTFIGGINDERGRSIVLSDGNEVFITGYTRSSDFPTTSGAYDESYNSFRDVFVIKLNPSGSGVLYSTFIGGADNDVGQSIFLDSDNNVFLTGYTYSNGFPTTDGAYDRVFNGGGNDVFVTKLNSTGSALVYSTFIGGSDGGGELGYSIAADALGYVYVTGYTTSPNFPTTFGSYDQSHNGGRDVYVVKFNPNGSGLEFSTFIGGSNDDHGSCLSFNSSGDVFITGTTFSSDFPTTAGAYDMSFNGGSTDAFVTRLNSNSSSLDFSTYIGGDENDELISLVLDNNSNVYLSGSTTSSNFPTTAGAYDDTFNGVEDVAVVNLNSAGSTLLDATFIGGSEVDRSYAIKIDNMDNLFITGYTFSSNYPTTAGAYDLSFNGSLDVFVTKLGLEIFPTVEVIQPNGGEIWQGGVLHNVSWSSSEIDYVHIEYSIDGGNNWNDIVSSTLALPQSYEWTVPNTPSTNCLVRISDASDSNPSDISDNVFTITQGAEIPVSLPNVTEDCDSDVEIPITIGQLTGEGILAFEFTVTYDPTVLTATGINTVGTITDEGSWSVLPNVSTPGEIQVAGFGTSPLSGEGLFIYLQFHTLSDEGAISPLSFADFLFNTGTPSVTTTNGTVTTICCICGDADDNGIVQAYDAALTLQHVLEIITLDKPYCVDVDGNELVQAYDASLIGHHVLGLDVPDPNCWNEKSPVHNSNNLGSINLTVTIDDVQENIDESLILLGIEGFDFGSGVTALQMDIELSQEISSFKLLELSENYLSGINKIGDYSYRIGVVSAYGIDPDEIKLMLNDNKRNETLSLNFSNIYVNSLLQNTIDLNIQVQNVPVDYELSAYPNPFNPEIKISYKIPTTEKVEVKIFDMLGRKITTLVNRLHEAGNYQVIWDGTNENGNKISSGNYIVILNANNISKTIKINLLK